MHRSCLSASLACLLLAVATAARAQKTPVAPDRRGRPAGSSDVHRGLSITLFSATMDNPILREVAPTGANSGEVLTGQSARATGLRIGWLGTTPRFGLELGVSYHKARLSDFGYSSMQMGPDTLSYRDASVSLTQGEIVIFGAPWRGVPLFLEGLFGLGSQHRTYTISGSTGGFVDGRRSFGEFSYSYALGLRLAPIRQVSLVVEYRWVPGDTHYTAPSTGCYYYVYVAAHGPAGLNASVAGRQNAASMPACTSHTNRAHLASLGVAIAVP
jgi:opacity protein-like surface antigen